MILESGMMTMLTLLVVAIAVIARSIWYAIDEIKHGGIEVKQTQWKAQC
jgi:hypothetical protein